MLAFQTAADVRSVCDSQVSCQKWCRRILVPVVLLIWCKLSHHSSHSVNYSCATVQPSLQGTILPTYTVYARDNDD